MKLTKQIDSVKARIKKAAEKTGRDQSKITLLCVVKEASLDDIVKAVEYGLVDIGENRIQNAVSRRSSVLGTYEFLRWHFIGHLQKNKAKKAVRLFDLIHSVDSIELAEELDKHSKEIGKVQDILLQINVSGEDTKFGLPPEKAEDFVKKISDLKHMRLNGLMTMAPYSDNPEDSRPHFQELRKLLVYLSQYNDNNVKMSSLSMGMSGDFEVAVEEGADIVRIGSAIFK